MVNEIEQVVSQFERGALTRRQLVGALLLLAAPVSSMAQSGKAASPALSLNHVHLDVTNLQRSIKFYGDVLGATVRDTSPNNATLSLPGKPTWISLTEIKEGKGHYNHVGFGVNFDSASRIAGDINKMYPDSKAKETGPTAKGPNTRSVYLTDPDGIRFQLNPTDDDGWLPTGPVGSRILKGEKG